MVFCKLVCSSVLLACEQRTCMGGEREEVRIKDYRKKKEIDEAMKE